MTLERTDAEWLQVYVDQGSDLAFEQIVSRHGPMVYRHCFRLLHDAHEAKDTSQAVFIVLAKQAGALRKNGNLTAWLFGVTRNVCRHALRCRVNRQRREEEGAIMLELERDSAQAIESQSVVLDLVYRELGALTSLQRQAVILRYIEGRREDNAAGLAGCSVDALHRRATDGIAKLRQRLAKRGVAVGGVALASLLTSEASAAVPETLLPSILATVKTAVATTATATTATTTAAMLAKRAMKAMFIAKVKLVAAIAAAVIVTGTAVPVGIAVAQAASKEAKLAGDYLVIDLSGGPSASNYPVGYLSAVPSGGWTDEYKTTKLVMRKIPAGTFVMGSPTNELGRSTNQTQHTVTLTKAFYIGVFEVTQRQWELVMGSKPSYFNNATCYATHPVEQVSYYDIRESTNNRAMSPNWLATNAVHADTFMGKLRAKTGVTGFDLPTESQWEYACRAGTDTALNSGYNLTNTANDAQINVVGRYRYNGGWSASQGCETNHSTAAVGTYQANAWGLYDMHGNVWEWCLYGYETNLLTVTDPKGAASRSIGVIRGGGCDSLADDCRSAFRGLSWPVARSGNLGFRAAMTLPDKAVWWVDTPELRVPFLKTPPTIDGVMNPGEWDDASALSAFFDGGRFGAFTNLAVHQVQPQVYAGYDSTNLYFCFTTPIYPEGYLLKARGTMPDVIVHHEHGMSADDHMEIEIRPVEDLSSGYYRGMFRLDVNPIGTVADWYWSRSGGQDLRWNSGGTIRSKADGKRWVVEYAIPLKSLRYGDYDAKDAKGQPLVALPPSDGTTYRVWFACKIGDNFSSFDAHGWNTTKTKLILDSQSPAFQLNDLGPITDGQVDVQMTVKNHSTRPETVRIGFQVESATGTVYSSYQSSEIPNGLVELRPGELRKLRIRQDNLPLTPNNNALWFDVRRLGAPEKTLYRTRLTNFQRTKNNAETTGLIK